MNDVPLIDTASNGATAGEMFQLRDGSTTFDPRLDRLQQFDERSRNYPVRAAISHTAPRSYTWPLDITLDQGREGACVGFSVAHELRAKPKVVAGVDQPLAMRLYKRAQFLDPWPGEQYSGTSVLAGVQAAQEMGYFKEYRWAFGVDDLALAVSRKGPAILGIDWYNSMYSPDRYEHGRYWISVGGQIAGGHAILCVGYNVKLNAFCLHNSWGEDWGTRGRAWITYADMDRLLRAGGEAVIPIVR